jgi:hypothetical protein
VWFGCVAFEKKRFPHCSVFRLLATSIGFGFAIGALVFFPVWLMAHHLELSPMIGLRTFGVFCLLVCVGFNAKFLPAMFRQRREEFERSLIFRGIHPVFGEYVHVCYTKTWWASAPLPSQVKVRVQGPGVSPSEAQVAIWTEIASRMPTLVETATKALLPPPKACRHSGDAVLDLSGVALGAAGHFDLEFECELVSDEIDLWPRARFSPDMQMLWAEWIP